MTIEEIRKKIINGEIKLPYSSNVIETGDLKKNSAESVKYKITLGWDPMAAIDCDKLWTAYKLKILNWIEAQDFPEEEKKRVIKESFGQDNHWDWFRKSYAFMTDDYEWFFLIADNKPQGVCLFYHPKESEFDDKKIFYIEFIAVAPWNRNIPMKNRTFGGIGTKLISCAWQHATNALGLADGFSLHSLPQAEKYYERLGMINFPVKDKPGLKYYEIPRNSFSSMVT